jgi:hypothetical protein
VLAIGIAAIVFTPVAEDIAGLRGVSSEIIYQEGM